METTDYDTGDTPERAARARYGTIPPELAELYPNDPIIYAGLNRFLWGQASYNEALEVIIVAQHSVIERQNEMLMDYTNRTPQPLTTPQKRRILDVSQGKATPEGIATYPGK